MQIYVWVFSIISLLVLSHTTYHAQTCPDTHINRNLVDNQILVFIRSGETRNEIWQFDFGEFQATYTGMSIPGDARNAALSPDTRFLAFTQRVDLDKLTVKVYAVDWAASELIELSSIQDLEVAQNINFHWLGNYNSYSANIPIDSTDTNWFNTDLLIEYNPDFSYAAFIDLYTERPIQFWDLRERHWLQSNVEIPALWVGPTRAFTWSADGNDFLIMDDESNWFQFSISDDTFRQLTDVGDVYILGAPVPSDNAIVFQVSDIELGNYDLSIAVWQNGKLIQTCLNVGDGQFHTDWRGWDNSSHLFAFAVFDYVSDTTEIHLFDTKTPAFSTIYFQDKADASMKVLGWLPVE